MHIAVSPKKFNQSEKGFVVWFTGLSGSGKSTMADLLNQEFKSRGLLSLVLDGDKLRAGLSSDLDFSLQGRRENIRRTAEVCKIMIEAGIIALASLITPVEKDRQWMKGLLGSNVFLVYLDCPLEICEQRDPKGLYKSAWQGKIRNFTGIGSAYEIPADPDLVLKTHLECPSECVKRIWSAIECQFLESK
jgi:adenylylsulfate kinase